MTEERLLSDEQLNEAFDNAFEKPVSFDHKPTADEILTFKLRAVADKAASIVREELIKEIEVTLDIRENSMGFCEISNHTPFLTWQSIKGGNDERS